MMPYKTPEEKRKYAREWQARWRKAHPDKAKALQQKYAQNNKPRRRASYAKYRRRVKYRCEATRPCPAACEACRTPFAVIGRTPCFDHDHKRSEFRGWLCNDCNFALGNAKDSRDRLQLLIDYLDRYELLR